MQHGLWAFTLPEHVARLLAWVGDDRKRWRLASLALGGDLDPCLSGNDSPAELLYDGHPFEFVPVLWQGGDSLQYGLVVHDEGAVPQMASYAPGDSSGPRWLGDDAAGGLANLMATQRAFAGRGPGWDPGSDEAEEYRVSTEAAIGVVAAMLEVDVPADTQLTRGARSDRDLMPTAPGWIFEECNDDVGVFAPAAAFDPEPFEENEYFDEEADMELAVDLLARGFPGSSLAVARNIYHFTRTDGDRGALGAEAMRRAYEALGRDWLVRRVDAYLALP